MAQFHIAITTHMTVSLALLLLLSLCFSDVAADKYCGTDLEGKLFVCQQHCISIMIVASMPILLLTSCVLYIISNY